MSTAIKIENVSKQYRLGQVGTGTISHDLNRWWAKLRGKDDPYSTVGQVNDRSTEATGEYVWALKDINFEVEQGEILGIIGRNGAGKSTLLKLLSRVTAPTTGTIKTKGRIASLLEVGTGMHPEMTGRENIYMNGAILGMRRHEITKQLDAIVEFSGCAKYLDTPVKRYSTGMMVRLGFAVAAHLQCEILIVDEVLAVGDAEFQKKCIGKMKEVSQSGGRTVLFVSHNMTSIKSLCNNGLLLSQGCIEQYGSAELVIEKYLSHKTTGEDENFCWELEDAPGDENVKLLHVKVESESGSTDFFPTDQSITVEFGLQINRIDPSLCIGFDLVDESGTTVFRSFNTDSHPDDWGQLTIGQNRLSCTIPERMLNAGQYVVLPRVGLHNATWIISADSGPIISSSLSHGISPFWAVLNSRNRPGCIAPIYQWNCEG